MPQALASNLRMSAGRKHLCRVGVPKVVESDAGQAGLAENADPLMCEGAGLQRLTVDLGHNETVAVWTDAKAKLPDVVVRTHGPVPKLDEGLVMLRQRRSPWLRPALPRERI